MKNKHQSNGEKMGQSIDGLKATECHLEKIQIPIHTSPFTPNQILQGLKKLKV